MQMTKHSSLDPHDWKDNVIREEEVTPYLIAGKDFIDDDRIEAMIKENENPDPVNIRDIFEKSLSIETLKPEETAVLLNLEDEDLIEEMFDVAAQIKKKVYDNRIVTFAPLYCSNYCVNDCSYCGFRRSNSVQKKRRLRLEEVRREAEILAGEIGHKRLITVYGEHSKSNVHYIADTIGTIYDVKVKTRRGYGQIRRVNVNAAPLSIEDYGILRDKGIGTYQIFQETYSHKAYASVHPAGTIKSNYRWRLYALHRALEAGVDDVAIGALFGLYDWRFEVMGLLYHAIDLEQRFNGIGPHTVSFPRLEPAANTPFVRETGHLVSDKDFKKLVAIIRLSIPYAGMIITAREPENIRKEIIQVGCTQTDASTRIGIGSYSDRYSEQESDRQQFLLGDTRSLDHVIRDFAEMGLITSFCTAGYRCGRTGEHIMALLKNCKEAKYCKLNAILTFREWLDDFATPETRKAGERVIQKEMKETEDRMPSVYPKLLEYYQRIKNGERDLYF